MRQYFILSGLAVALGVFCGFAAIGVRYLLSWSTKLFFAGGSPLDNPYGLLLILVPAAGGLATGLIVYFISPESKGHGIPQVMEAVLTKEGRMKPMTMVTKAVTAAISIGSGGSAGREGPIVQIGAALGSSIAQLLKLPSWMTKVLLGCGAAGALAAAFNAPIAGVIFALELIVPEFKTRSFIPLTITSVFATFTARLFLHDVVEFAVPSYSIVHPTELVLYIILGVVAGLAGVLFVRTIYFFEDKFEALHVPGFIKPMLGGLVVGGIGLFFPEVMGIGYSSIAWMLTLPAPTVLSVGLLAFVGCLMLFKALATSFTLGSGGSGGVFLPSLFIGAMLGGLFGLLWGGVLPDGFVASPGAYALVGMAAVFAACSRATLASIIILFEMTLNYQIIIPLMLACVTADAVAVLIQKDTIYTKSLRRKGILVEYDREVSPLRTTRACEVMVVEVVSVRETDSVETVLEKVVATGFQAFPVVDANNRLLGMIAQEDIRRASRAGCADRPVADFLSKDLATVPPDATLEDATKLMADRRIGHLPVVDPKDSRRMLGLLTRSDIVEAMKSKSGEGASKE